MNSSRTFKVPKNPYDEEKNLYTKSTVTIYPGLSVLIGCNGSGKSTLLHLMKDELKNEKDILLLNYNDRHDGQNNLMNKFGFLENFTGLATMVCSSEGERIFIGIRDFFSGLGVRITKKNPKEIWILMDAIGSGLSVDGIDEIKDFVGFIQEQNKGTNLYFVVATNEFEFARDADCIDVTTFRHRKFKGYDAYRNFILKTRQQKNIRLGVIEE